MKQKGRKKEDVLSLVVPATIARLAPPKELTATETELWNNITATKKPDFFDDATGLLLAEYCRLKTTLDLIGEEIEVYLPLWLETDKGVARYRDLTNIRDKAQGRMIALARSMRLTNQSRYQPSQAASRTGRGMSNDHLWKRD